MRGRGIFGYSSVGFFNTGICPNFIKSRLTKMSSTCGKQSKPVVTIISQFLDGSFTTSIAKHCPQATFVRIEHTVRIKMPALISEQITVCSSEQIEPCSELVVEQEVDATVKKATVPRDVRLNLFKTQCEDLIYYLQTHECRSGLSKKEIRNIKNKAATHQFNSANISSERLQDVEILIGDPPDVCKWINKLPKLKWMQSTYAGVDPMFSNLSQDMPLPSFVLTRLGGILGPIIAEYVVGHIIARERKFALSWKYQQTKTWGTWDEMGYRLLSDVTIGILGFGEIGQEIAKYCKSLKMTVNSIQRTVPTTKCSFVDECFSVEDLRKCLKQCDYICSVLPSTLGTRGLLSGDVLENCKEKKTVLINVGRGDVISNDSILKALDNRWIGGAILDVFEKEPLSPDSALWSHPQVVITPHVSGLTIPSQVISAFLENFELYKAGKPMKYVVDWNKGY